MRWLFCFFLPWLIYADEIVPEEIQPKPVNLSSELYQKQFFHTLIIIVVIVITAFVLIWLMRRFSKDRPLQMNHKKNIKILERRQISPNTYLYHMEIGTKQFVISESKCDVRLITNLDWNEPENT